MSWFNASLVGLLILLQGKLWLGEGGIQDLWELEEAISGRQGVINELKARNQVLAAEITDLKTGVIAIEERARSELGMIRPGEVFYQVVAK